jgi:hypothetical protein
MTSTRNIYGDIDNKTNVHEVFLEIRKDVEQAQSRSELTELYRRAGYLIALSYAPAWEKKFGDELGDMREAAKQEFRTTARKVNTRAKEIGVASDYDEAWGKMKK